MVQNKLCWIVFVESKKSKQLNYAGGCWYSGGDACGTGNDGYCGNRKKLTNINIYLGSAHAGGDIIISNGTNGGDAIIINDK